MHNTHLYMLRHTAREPKRAAGAMATGHNTITARLMEFLQGRSIIRTFPGYYGDYIRQDQYEIRL